MSDRSRWDPEMVAYQQAGEAIAAKFPPVKLELPLEPHRAVNDAITLARMVRGPDMAETTERWIAARGRRIYCRVHRPRTDRPLPVLVYFHGGGWVWGSVDTHDCAARSLAAGGEVATVSVDYALSPEAKFPQALEECAAVVRHISREGAAWGFDPSRILLGGDSAGGNLALATALLLRDTGGPALAGIVTAYPVCDSRLDTPSYREFSAGHVLTRDKMAFYWDSYVPHEADRAHPLAAPLRADLTGLPPVLVLLAELDVLRSEGEALVAKLRAAAVPVETETYAGVLHGFFRATDGLQKARDAVARAGAWVKRVAHSSR
ncbi:MAG TPA: alpha/beta hydrolase [Acetobacteraceae bacterium]|jgi:acetyl esterase|nr:alpha/beta hydrolase [Acetobacteraceae bacterium]